LRGGAKQAHTQTLACALLKAGHKLRLLHGSLLGPRLQHKDSKKRQLERWSKTSTHSNTCMCIAQGGAQAAAAAREPAQPTAAAHSVTQWQTII
jgi:hypothetical protein